jgi:hypothetical protein
MKIYHIYFIVLKILILIQIAAIFFKKSSKNSELYIISDTIFKASAGFYLILFFIIHSFPGLDFEDTMILRFSGVIILFDIDYSGILSIIAKYVPWLSKYVAPLEIIQSIQDIK